MQFEELKKQILDHANQYANEFNIEMTSELALLKLQEELGELVSAYLALQKKSRPEKYLSVSGSKERLAQEIADVIGVAVVLSQTLDINIEQAIKNKWSKK